MTDKIDYNNPLQGVGLKQMLTELVDHYDFPILFAYLNINCFKNNPSIAASVKFLKKTEWARQKVEVFYLYQYKNLPKVSSEQFALPPRERIVPAHQKPREPAELSLEDAEIVNEKRAKKAASRDQFTGAPRGSSKAYNERRNAGFYKSNASKSDSWSDKKSSGSSGKSRAADPWGNWKGDKEESSYETEPKRKAADPWGNWKGDKEEGGSSSESSKVWPKESPKKSTEAAPKESPKSTSSESKAGSAADPWGNWKEK